MKRCLVIIVALLFSWPGLALSVDGSTWQELGKDLRAVYVMGVVDTWGNLTDSIEFAEKTTPERRGSLIERQFVDPTRCMRDRKMRYVQLVAIVEKYMKNHPEEWHDGMASIVWTAIAEICRK